MKKQLSKSAFLVLLLTGISLLACASDFTVFIKVADNNNKPLPYTTVTLVNKADTSKHIGTITDSSAIAQFEVSTGGWYRLSITALGFAPYTDSIKITEDKQHFDARLSTQGSVLNEVVVQVSKPLMQQEDDKTIINPESLEAASTNAYEILEKTPGLFLDQDGNIYISSITPATVYINGREMKMSRTDIATMLKSLPPNSIEKIEILRTPSAKYDASGSGGIVNVVLKKGVKIGVTGSINTGYQQGTYSNEFAGISISDNNGPRTIYLNLNYAYNNNYQILNTQRQIAADTFLNQKAYTTHPGNVAYIGYGIRQDIKQGWDISYDGRLNLNSGKNYTGNTNDFEDVGNELLLGSSDAVSVTDDKTFILNQDISSTYKIDSAGSEWTNSFSYVYNHLNESMTYNTYSALPYGGNGTASNSQHFLSFQSDFTYKFPYQISFESGIKTTYLPFSNKADYTLNYNGNTVADNSRTTQYQYKENINAAYIQASKTWGHFILKSGLRMENTNMNGLQHIPADTSFAIHRIDFFPYVYLSRKVMTIAHYELRAYLVYRRTISRPSYEQLNPFPKYVDQFLSDVGNPALQPQFSNNYEFNISVDEHPLLVAGINDTKNMFTNVYYQGDSLNAMAYRTYDNIGQNKEFYLRGLGVIPPGGRYFFVFGAQYNHNFYQGLYQGQPISYNGDSWLFFTYHQLKIDNNSMLTLQGFMRLKGALQFYDLSSFGALNLNINRKFFDQKVTVTLSLRDALFTNNNEFSIYQPTVNATGYRETDSRRIGINIRYNFGMRKKEDATDIFKFPIQQ